MGVMRSVGLRAVVFLWSVLALNSCTKDELTEFPSSHQGELFDVDNIRLVTYNIHGGKGPDGEGALNTNLVAFRELLQSEAVICMQEVEPGCWNALKSIFPDHPYRFYLSQHSTKFGTHLSGGNAIFSKVPVVDFDERLIQTDPGGDKWERKAQYVKLYVGGIHGHLHLFHYHNTYNWHENDSEWEKQGFSRFMDWVRTFDIPSNEALVVTGDFNLLRADCEQYLLPGEVSFRASAWVDHVFSSASFLQNGSYPTVQMRLSDHNAVWADVCNEDC
ncbi:MAG: endonuclease/exonuclease/phosphatase family protein [Bacteroidetes bacterium]|nr:MAG: endonuclease/exonuclease/phosphatase family protein [Bacteroidota bacterium]